jgi:hypothetical protein
VRTIEHGVITRNVDRFLRVQTDGSEQPSGRERSWDFCFNYFQAHPEPTQDLELSCLQLGYYLASWGMLRGSSWLQRSTNVSHYRATIEAIEQVNPDLRGIDAGDYQNPAVRAQILDTYRVLTKTLLPEGGTPETLVTKVMMGVWGVIPAYDVFLKGAFRHLGETPKERAAFNYPRERSLALLANFYAEHADEIDNLAGRLRTIDFASGQPTEQHVTRMKVIDMFAFQVGFDGPRKVLGSAVS